MSESDGTKDWRVCRYANVAIGSDSTALLRALAIKPDNDIVEVPGTAGTPDAMDARAVEASGAKDAPGAVGATDTKGVPGAAGTRGAKGAALNPVAALALCAILWSFGGVIIKLIKWDALAIAGIRSLLGMITLSVAFRRPPKLFVRRGAKGGGKKDSRVKRGNDMGIDWRATVNLLLGGIFYAATMLLFVPATKMTTAANAILLQYTNPIYIIMLGPLLTGEKNDWIDFAAVAGILAGMVLLLWGDLGGGQTAGNILALLSGATYGLTTIFLRRAKNTRPSDSLNLSCLLSFLFALPFIVKAGLPQSAMSYPAVICLGVFQIGLPAVLLSLGIEKVPALSSVIITMLEPMMNPVWVALFAGEIPSASSILGGLVILAFIVAHIALKRAVAVRKMRG